MTSCALLRAPGLAVIVPAHAPSAGTAAFAFNIAPLQQRHGRAGCVALARCANGCAQLLKALALTVTALAAALRAQLYQAYLNRRYLNVLLRYGIIETVAFKHYTPDPRANGRGRTRLPSMVLQPFYFVCMVHRMCMVHFYVYHTHWETLW